MGCNDEKCARWLAKKEKNDTKDIEEAEKELAKKTTKQNRKASLEEKWQGPPDGAERFWRPTQMVRMRAMRRMMGGRRRVG